ncbi:regulatory protein RecX [Rothia aerolata]|uniref:Regulatory protein RecX n=1 Tax=Rothia aerolata TaxID=1812262 RepID=A0A917IUM4_9MICC|nr:regulatory protein RecX [Rothia aerolata]GGH63622.1 hypothetical protein GCM10007359_15120 [Rothia aerolata]
MEDKEEFPAWHPAALGETEDFPGVTVSSALSQQTGTPYTGRAKPAADAGAEADTSSTKASDRADSRGRARRSRAQRGYKKGFRKPSAQALAKSPFAPALGGVQAEEGRESHRRQKPAKDLMFSEGSRLAETGASDEFEAALIQGLGTRPESGRGGRRAPKEPESEFSRAKNIVLNQLAASAKSRAQLEKKLAEKEISEETAADILDRFEAAKLVNDEEFAQMYVRQRADFKKLSKSAIRRELAQKGVTGELAETALEQRSDEDERSDAHELVRKKLRLSMNFSDRKERDKIMRRLVGTLGRKGFPPSMAFSVVKEEIDRFIEENNLESSEQGFDYF